MKQVKFALTLVLLFFSSAVLAVQFPLEKSGTRSASQMGITANVTVFKNGPMTAVLDYSNGNRDIKRMYATTYIVLVDAQGNLIYGFKRQRSLGAVSCFLGICGKTVCKSETVSTTIPSDIVGKVHDVKFFFSSSGHGYSVTRTMEGIEEVLPLVISLF